MQLSWYLFLKPFFFFFDVGHFKSLDYICYNIAYVLCFGVLAVKHMGSYLLDQGSNPYPLHRKAKF